MFHFNQDYLFMTLILLDIVGDKFILVIVEIKDVDWLLKFVFPISAVTYIKKPWSVYDLVELFE